jgi:PBS lyase HEAT-like repeat
MHAAHGQGRRSATLGSKVSHAIVGKHTMKEYNAKLLPHLRQNLVSFEPYDLEQIILDTNSQVEPRMAALMVLGTHASEIERIINICHRLLNDTHESLRALSIMFFGQCLIALGEVPTVVASSAIDKLRFEKCYPLYGFALVIRGLLNDSTVVDECSLMIKSCCPFERVHAVKALGAIGTEAALELLGEALHTERDHQMRVAIASQLAKNGRMEP